MFGEPDQVPIEVKSPIKRKRENNKRQLNKGNGTLNTDAKLLIATDDDFYDIPIQTMDSKFNIERISGDYNKHANKSGNKETQPKDGRDRNEWIENVKELYSIEVKQNENKIETVASHGAKPVIRFITDSIKHKKNEGHTTDIKKDKSDAQFLQPQKVFSQQDVINILVNKYPHISMRLINDITKSVFANNVHENTDLTDARLLVENILLNKR